MSGPKVRQCRGESWVRGGRGMGHLRRCLNQTSDPSGLCWRHYTSSTNHTEPNEEQG